MENPNSENIRMQEMEELLALAEVTSKKIEAMRDMLQNQKDGVLYKLMALYALLGSSAYAFIFSTNYDFPWGFRSIFQVLLIAVTLFAIFYFVRATTSNLRKRKKILRELDIERDIQTRLISMIFDQFQRVQHEGDLTTVSEALLHIRIQRLKTE